MPIDLLLFRVLFQDLTADWNRAESCVLFLSHGTALMRNRGNFRARWADVLLDSVIAVDDSDGYLSTNS